MRFERIPPLQLSSVLVHPALISFWVVLAVPLEGVHLALACSLLVSCTGRELLNLVPSCGTLADAARFAGVLCVLNGGLDGRLRLGTGNDLAQSSWPCDLDRTQGWPWSRRAWACTLSETGGRQHGGGHGRVRA